MEDDPYNGGTAISVEEKFYNIDNTKIILQTSLIGSPLPTHQNNNSVTNNNPYSNTGADSKRVYLLNATNNTVADKNGLGIVLKVMAGDAISIWGKSYHKKPGGADYTSSPNPLSVIDLMNMLAGSPAVSSKGISGTQISQLPGFLINVTTLLNNQPDQNPNRPRASINWIILDEQFKYVSSGFDMVETANATDWALKNHTIPNIAIPKNGYIYVYCSNESQYNVFFDNLQVVHDRGPILEETHYYPFGLTMAGISSKSAGSLINRKKFVGQEFNQDFDIDLYEFKWRHHDPQIGRFIEIDPLADKYVYNSAYAYAENRPIDGVDLEGLEFARKVDANCVSFQITTQTVLNTNAVSPQMANAITQDVNKTLGNAFSGVTDQQSGLSYSANYSSSVVSTGDAKNSIVVNIQDFVTDAKGGYINGTNAGNSQSGIVSVAALDMSNVSKVPGTYEPACTPRSVEEIGSTIAHELPHQAGKLGHPWDANQPGDISQNCPDGTRSNVSTNVIYTNLLNSGGNPNPGIGANTGRTTLTPGQVNVIDQKVQSEINDKKKNN